MTAAALWWSYFDTAAPTVEAYFTGLHGQTRGRFACDAHSIFHDFLVIRIVLFAVAADEVVKLPSYPLGTVGTIPW